MSAPPLASSRRVQANQLLPKDACAPPPRKQTDRIAVRGARVCNIFKITGAEATKTPLQNQAELDLLSKSSFFVKNSWLKTKKYRKLVVLYDIEDDPREVKDISDENQSVVIQLLSKVF